MFVIIFKKKKIEFDKRAKQANPGLSLKTAKKKKNSRIERTKDERNEGEKRREKGGCGSLLVLGYVCVCMCTYTYKEC